MPRRRVEPNPEILNQSFEDWFEVYEPKYRNSAGIRRHLSDLHGRDGWGEDEFVQYLMELYEQDVEDARRGQREKKELPIAEGTAEERFQTYMSYYEDPAPNDVLLLRQMARIESQLDTIQENWETAIADGERTASKGWSDMLKSLTDEHRAIQTTLGISRSSRDRTKSREDLADYIQDIIGKTARFLDEHTVQIRCPECKRSPAETEIDMGFILFHFRQDVPWSFEFECPLCQETVKLP